MRITKQGEKKKTIKKTWTLTDAKNPTQMKHILKGGEDKKRNLALGCVPEEQKRKLAEYADLGGLEKGGETTSPGIQKMKKGERHLSQLLPTGGKESNRPASAVRLSLPRKRLPHSPHLAEKRSSLPPEEKGGGNGRLGPVPKDKKNQARSLSIGKRGGGGPRGGRRFDRCKKKRVKGRKNLH